LSFGGIFVFNVPSTTFSFDVSSTARAVAAGFNIVFAPVVEVVLSLRGVSLRPSAGLADFTLFRRFTFFTDAGGFLPAAVLVRAAFFEAATLFEDLPFFFGAARLGRCGRSTEATLFLRTFFARPVFADCLRAVIVQLPPRRRPRTIRVTGHSVNRMVFSTILSKYQRVRTQFNSVY
jgi:hypothetical protein